MTILAPTDRASLRPRPHFGLTRRDLMLAAAGGLGFVGVAGGTAAYAAGVEALELGVTDYALAPPGWPAEEPLSIAVIADLHAGGPNMGLARVSQVVDATNALQCDLVVLLGDYYATHRFVTERVAPEAWAGELARLAAPHGVWAILGNHDWWYFTGTARRALRAVHIPVLENDAVLLGTGARKFWLAGLGDQIAFRLGHGRFRGVDDLPGTLAKLNTDDPAILLIHEPDIFPRIPSRVALTLAGHTHGGQLRLPLIWPAFVPSRYGARYAYGHIVEGGRHMVVSGGIGTSIVPARLGMPPEILRIRLGPAPQARPAPSPRWGEGWGEGAVPVDRS